MSAFSRVIVPNYTSEPRIAGATLVSVGISGKSQERGTTAAGIRWFEDFPPIDHTSQAGRQWIGHLRYRLRSPDSFTIRPYRYGGTPDGSDFAADATGAIAGASQTGSSIDLDSFGSDGTIPAGNYLTGIGPGACFLLSDLTIASGAGTASIDPPIFDLGHAPTDGGTVTLNGVVNARIANKAAIDEFLGTIEQSVYTRVGIRIVFQETLE